MANLLIVDDNEDIAALTAMVLEAEGHLVRIARNGEEGLRALDTELQCRWFRLTECRSGTSWDDALVRASEMAPGPQ